MPITTSAASDSWRDRGPARGSHAARRGRSLRQRQVVGRARRLVSGAGERRPAGQRELATCPCARRGSAGDLRRSWVRRRHGGPDRGRAGTPRARARLLLGVDQFEETFAARDERERRVHRRDHAASGPAAGSWSCWRCVRTSTALRPVSPAVAAAGATRCWWPDAAARSSPARSRRRRARWGWSSSPSSWRS